MLNNKVFKKEFTRPELVQAREFAFVLWARKYKINSFIIPISKEESDIYFDYEAENKHFRSLSTKITNKKYWQKHYSQFRLNVKEFVKPAMLLQKQINKPKKEILRDYTTYFKKLTYFADNYFLMPLAVERILYPKAKDMLTAIYKEKTDDLIEILNSQTILLDYQKARLELLNLVAKGTVANEIERYTKKWSWMNIYNYIDDPFDSKYFLSTVKNITKEEAIKEIKETINLIKSNKQKFNSLLKKTKNKELKHLLTVINWYVSMRTERVDVWKKSMLFVRDFYIWLKTELNKLDNGLWSLVDVGNLTTKEVVDFLKYDKKPILKDVKERSEYYFIRHYLNGKSEFITDKKESEKIRKYLEGNTCNVCEFKGQTAQMGKAKSFARVVLIKKELHDFKEGEILVCPMTHPEFVPAMKKSAAIVTNEGGITCHAAIISRELKKPCIIGTNNATRVLHTGDFVEVDADKGVVRILKRK